MQYYALFSMCIPYIICISGKKIPNKEALKESPARLVYGDIMGLWRIILGFYGQLWVFVYNYKHSTLIGILNYVHSLIGCCVSMGRYLYLYFLIRMSVACSVKRPPARVVVTYGG